MKNTSSKNSRKASQDRGELVSIQGAESRCKLIKLGVDSHGQQMTFARMVDHQGTQPAQKLSPDRFIEFLKKQKTLAERVVMVYEAGPYGFSLYREVTALGIECLVCAPERLSRGRKRVNDKIDATELLSRLDRYLAGNATSLRMVRVPTLEQELRRRRARERNTYRKERQRWIARGRSLLHTMGISRPGKWWEAQRYDQLRKSVGERYGQEVLEQVSQELDRDVEMVNLMQKQMEELTEDICSSARARSEPRIKGIGHLSQELLDREMGDWNRFANRRQVASYTGLCPGEDSSGESQRTLSIDKHGNPRVRTVLVELAWLLPRFQPDYRRLQRWKWVFEQKGAKGMRKKAVVALARQLAVDLWRIKTGRATAQEMGLKLVA
jgi:transposase